MRSAAASTSIHPDRPRAPGLADKQQSPHPPRSTARISYVAGPALEALLLKQFPFYVAIALVPHCYPLLLSRSPTGSCSAVSLEITEGPILGLALSFGFVSAPHEANLRGQGAVNTILALLCTESNREGSAGRASELGRRSA